MLRLKMVPSLATCLIAVDLFAWSASALYEHSTEVLADPCAPSIASDAPAPRRSGPITLISAAEAAPESGLAGIASWYGQHWQGRETASGTRFNWRKLTAAHRTLPLNTPVRVTNQENGRSVVVVVNDRGPYVDGRVIDLSLAAAKRLGMLHDGLAQVCIEPLDRPSSNFT